MPGIGIIGNGIGALHLALLLQQKNIRTVLYAGRSPEDMRRSRLLNTVVRFRDTVEREESLDLDTWSTDLDPTGFRFNIQVDPKLTFRGGFQGACRATDFRLYLPDLMDTYVARGGTLKTGRVDQEHLSTVVDEHELTVVATGVRDPLADIFPAVPGESSGEARRAVMAGLFDGFTMPDPPSASLTLAPGKGEIYIGPMRTFDGTKMIIILWAMLDGPWQDLVRRKFATGEELTGPLLDLLRSVEADEATPIDDRKFALARPEDLLQGGVPLYVRRPWAELASGRYVVGLGDVVTPIDPVIGQGANLASTCAEALADAICQDFAYDGIFVKEWERRQWQLAEPVVRWDHLALGEPPQQVLDVLAACDSSQPVADAFARFFENPRRAWPSLATPERADRFIARATDQV